jgi:hypothetical protein
MAFFIGRLYRNIGHFGTDCPMLAFHNATNLLALGFT